MKITVTPRQVRNLLESLGRVTTGDSIRSESLTPDQIKSIAGLFPVFEPDVAVEVGTLMQWDGELYEAVQAHTTQPNWTPPDVPALWKSVSAPGVIPEWRQPTGAQDAYTLGMEVTHEGTTWKSISDANVWEPPTQWEAI